MRADARDFDLVTPPTLDAVLALLRDEPGVYRPFAGGTDLMVVYATGRLAHRRFVNLWGLPDLRGVVETDAGIEIGALTTYDEIRRSPILAASFPLMGRAAAETGGWAIQNRGTLGGNVANGSPAADTPPALLAYGADIELASAAGRRWIPYAAFHLGYRRTALREDELVTRVRLPREADGADGTVDVYRKVGPRRAQAISKVCFAGRGVVRGGRLVAARVAFGGVAPIPTLCPRTAAALVDGDLAADPDRALDRAARALAAEIAPIDDLRSNAPYRRRVAENLLGAFAREIAGRI